MLTLTNSASSFAAITTSAFRWPSTARQLSAWLAGNETRQQPAVFARPIAAGEVHPATTSGAGTWEGR